MMDHSVSTRRVAHVALPDRTRITREHLCAEGTPRGTVEQRAALKLRSRFSNNSGMTDVRAATEQDSDELFELARRFATSFTPTHAAFRASLRQILDSNQAELLVVEIDNRLVGYLLGFAHPTFFADGPVGWIEGLMIDEQHRLSGLGRLLVQAFESWARQREARLVAVATRRASDFYLGSDMRNQPAITARSALRFDARRRSGDAKRRKRAYCRIASVRHQSAALSLKPGGPALHAEAS
jgi:GNAT superfamily N-acetyltransferase